MRALSIRQPAAEQIMLGTKTSEYRSRPTSIRERVYIDAACGRFDAETEAELALETGLDLDALPRGVLVGTVEIVDCEQLAEGEYAWHLARPERAKRLLKPKKHPQPAWFHPF